MNENELRDWIGQVRHKFRLPDLPERRYRDPDRYWDGYDACLSDLERFADKNSSSQQSDVEQAHPGWKCPDECPYACMATYEPCANYPTLDDRHLADLGRVGRHVSTVGERRRTLRNDNRWHHFLPAFYKLWRNSRWEKKFLRGGR